MPQPGSTASSRLFWGTMAIALAVRMVWAAYAPLSNDESYYWDWSRALQLSFLDHPPGVAWLGWLARQVWGGALAVRGTVPFVHVVAAWFMWYQFKFTSCPVP